MEITGMDALAPELPPQNEIEQLLAITADRPDDATAARALITKLLEVHVALPGREGEQGFAPELRDFGGTTCAVAFTHPARVERFFQLAGPAERKLVIHGIAGRDLFRLLVANELPLLLNPANGASREFPVAELAAALAD